MAESLTSMAAQVLDEIQQVFKSGGNGLDNPAVGLVEEIARARDRRIVLHGVGREGLMMRAFTMRLYHLGLNAHCLGDMSCPPIGEGDLFIASAGPGSFSSVDALITTARDAGARVVVATAQPGGKAPGLGHTTIYLPAQTMADDDVANGSNLSRTADVAGQQHNQEKILPMGSVYEGAMFVLFEIAVFLLRRKLGETVETMRSRHTNLE